MSNFLTLSPFLVVKTEMDFDEVTVPPQLRKSDHNKAQSANMDFDGTDQQVLEEMDNKEQR